MFAKYDLIKEQGIVESTEVLHICKICKTLFTTSLLQKESNICTCCVKRNNIPFFLFSLKSIIYKKIDDLKQKKSWYFFQNLEKKLVNLTEQNETFEYCFHNLFWYIQKNTTCIDRIVETIQNIEFTFIEFYKIENYSLLDAQDIKNQLYGKKTFLYTNFCKSYFDVNSSPTLHSVINRKLLQKKLDTNLSFFVFE